MAKNNKTKKGFVLDGDRKTTKRATSTATTESPQARGARTRRERAAQSERAVATAPHGKSLHKPILGAVRMTQLKGGAISIVVTPVTL